MPIDSTPPSSSSYSISTDLMSISKVHDIVSSLVSSTYPSLLSRLEQSIALIVILKWRLKIASKKQAIVAAATEQAMKQTKQINNEVEIASKQAQQTAQIVKEIDTHKTDKQDKQQQQEQQQQQQVQAKTEAVPVEVTVTTAEKPTSIDTDVAMKTDETTTTSTVTPTSTVDTSTSTSTSTPSSPSSPSPSSSPFFLPSTSIVNKKQLSMLHNRIAYDAGLLDEKLMRQLFLLDSISGGEIVKQARKACVKETNEWIAKCEQIKGKVNKWLSKIDKLKEWKGPEPVVVVTPPTTTTETSTETEQKKEKEEEVEVETMKDETNNKKSEKRHSSPLSAPASSSSSSSACPSPRSAPSSARVSQSAPCSPALKQRKLAELAATKAAELKSAAAKRASLAPPSPLSSLSSKPSGTASTTKLASSFSLAPSHSIFNKYLSLHLPRFHLIIQRLPSTATAVRLQCALPGVTEDDLQIAITDDNKLVMRGVKLPSRNEYLRSQYYGLSASASPSYGWFERELEIDTGLNLKQIQVQFENGMLHIVMPKKTVKVVKSAPKPVAVAVKPKQKVKAKVASAPPAAAAFPMFLHGITYRKQQPQNEEEEEEEEENEQEDRENRMVDEEEDEEEQESYPYVDPRLAAYRQQQQRQQRPLRQPAQTYGYEYGHPQQHYAYPPRSNVNPFYSSRAPVMFW